MFKIVIEKKLSKYLEVVKGRLFYFVLIRGLTREVQKTLYDRYDSGEEEFNALCVCKILCGGHYLLGS